MLLVSQTEADAVELLAKVQFIFDHLPEFLRPESKSNVRCLKLPGLHSAVVALPSTRRAGRGRTARLVVADEHSQHAWAEANFAALQPTMEASGQFLILSTAYNLRPGRDLTLINNLGSDPRALVLGALR